MKTAIFVRTNYDLTTAYSFQWCQPVIEAAQGRGFRTIVVEKEKVTKLEVSSRLTHVKPDFIFLSGHGTVDTFKGHLGEEVLSINSAEAFKGSIAYSRACNCLVGLGVKAVEKGCRAFIGYSREFWFVKQNEMQTRPLQDPAAKPIFEAANAVSMSLIKGSNVREAIEQSHKVAIEKIKLAIYSPDPIVKASLAPLISNDSCLEAIGDLESRI